MDDVAGQKEKQQANRQPIGPRRKYIEQLQEVADRKRNEIMIELDDLDNVIPSEYAVKLKLMYVLVREKPR